MWLGLFEIYQDILVLWMEFQAEFLSDSMMWWDILSSFFFEIPIRSQISHCKILLPN